ncbi:MAG: hypothetical protein EHM35_11770, partial [Planctomycetaceae bacterium]
VWPSWSQDSTCLYYRSRLDSNLYSISIRGENIEPTRVTACPGYNPSMSPDGQQMAYIEGTSLKVKGVALQSLIAEWPLPSPSDGWSAPAWSPDGKELGLGGSGGLENTTGLWIYRLGQSRPAQILGGPITVGSWAGNGTKLIFELGGPYYEIWTADLPAKAPAAVALGPSRTPEEHFREMAALYTRMIETDPRDAYSYSTRARYRDYLGEWAKADADMKRWSALMSGRLPSGFSFATPRALRHVLDMPFDCELVFSAERPVNTISTMSVAFGQKGRCEMKLFEIPMVVMSTVGFCFLSGLDAPPARADFSLGEVTNLGPAVNSSANEMVTVLSPDGSELYFGSTRSGGCGSCDIWVTKRGSAEDPWGPPVNLGSGINSTSWDLVSSISSDGLTLYFDSGGTGGDICTATRATKDSPWGTRVKLATSLPGDGAAVISPDDLELYFISNRRSGYGSCDIWVSTRETKSAPWGPAVNLGPVINSPALEWVTCISPDCLRLFFSSNRSGGFGKYDAWTITRPSKSSPWGPPRNLGAAFNTMYSDEMAAISADGRWCLIDDFEGPRPGGLGGSDIWQAPIIPIADFNGDGKVDAADMALLEANLGKNNSTCDIGPFAWGDGVVDEKDLGVLMKSLVSPSPGAADVSCDVVLSWTSPSFAPACDVYLGTSFEAVNGASRANPL